MVIFSFSPILDFSVYLRASQLGAIMDKNYYMMYDSTYKWSLGKEVLEREVLRMEQYQKLCMVWLLGELYTGMWHLWEKFWKVGQVPWVLADWLLIHWDQLFWASGSSGLSSCCVIRAQNALQWLTIKDWNWWRGSELLSSCDCNMQHIENSLMLKPFLYISSVHEISFKPPRVSPPAPHLPTIISGSNLKGLFNKYVLDEFSACENCQPIWSWMGGG